MSYLYELKYDIENTPKSDMPDRFIGAYVYLYVPCNILIDSISLSEERLNNDGYPIKELYAVKKIDFEEWDDDCEGFPSLDELFIACKNGEVLYSKFFCYSDEDEEVVNH